MIYQQGSHASWKVLKITGFLKIKFPSPRKSLKVTLVLESPRSYMSVLESTGKELSFVCLFSCTTLFVSISQVIGCEDRLRNDLLCVGWGVKLYSLTRCPLKVACVQYVIYKLITHVFICIGSSFFNGCCLPLKVTFLHYENVLEKRLCILKCPGKALEFRDSDRVGTLYQKHWC